MKKKAETTSATEAEVTEKQTVPSESSDAIAHSTAIDTQVPEKVSNPALVITVSESEPHTHDTKGKKKKAPANPQVEPEMERARKRIKITKTHKEKQAELSSGGAEAAESIGAELKGKEKIAPALHLQTSSARDNATTFVDLLVDHDLDSLDNLSVNDKIAKGIQGLIEV